MVHHFWEGGKGMPTRVSGQHVRQLNALHSLLVYIGNDLSDEEHTIDPGLATIYERLKSGT